MQLERHHKTRILLGLVLAVAAVLVATVMGFSVNRGPTWDDPDCVDDNPLEEADKRIANDCAETCSSKPVWWSWGTRSTCTWDDNATRSP